jgi:hypothetical protein
MCVGIPLQLPTDDISCPEINTALKENELCSSYSHGIQICIDWFFMYYPFRIWGFFFVMDYVLN